MKTTRWLAAIGASLALAACGPQPPSKQDQGLVVGAVAGGLLGNAVGRGPGGRAAGTVVGAVLGGVVGSSVGRSMDRQDRILAREAELDALERGESGRRREWRNPENGRYGYIEPGPPFQRGPEHCREYTHTIFIDGRPQPMRGVACRNPDGTWRDANA